MIKNSDLEDYEDISGHALEEKANVNSTKYTRNQFRHYTGMPSPTDLYEIQEISSSKSISGSFSDLDIDSEVKQVKNMTNYLTQEVLESLKHFKNVTKKYDHQNKILESHAKSLKTDLICIENLKEISKNASGIQEKILILKEESFSQRYHLNTEEIAQNLKINECNVGEMLMSMQDELEKLKKEFKDKEDQKLSYEKLLGNAETNSDSPFTLESEKTKSNCNCIII